MVSRGSLSGSFSKANRFLQRRIFPHRILECLRWIARYLLRSFQTISSTSQTRGDEQFTQPTTADGDRKTASPAATTLIGGQARAPSARPAYESEVVNRQAWDRRKSNSDRKLLHTIKGGPSEHPLYLHIGHIKLYGWRFSGLSTKLNNVRAYGLEGRRILSLSARVHSKCLQFVLDFGSWFWSAGGEAIPPIVGKLRWLFLFGYVSLSFFMFLSATCNLSYSSSLLSFLLIRALQSS
ncbi:hypothetical protein CPC08DRAFT_339536 [Agrocybe pediades]|nr:hypothetical protein CPC08DRAFT_339536 [Agrocybe pediades]